jgi:small subunit ribosomal protein S6
MVHYEVNFIIDPVLSGDEIKSTAKIYETLLSENGCNIVHVNEIGLKQLAYPINKRTSGVYYCIEFTTPNGVIISKLELALRRDERIIRFLTVKLDKYGIKYNEDRRTGKISSYKKREKKKPGEAAAVVEEPVAPARVPDVPVAPVAVQEEE